MPAHEGIKRHRLDIIVISAIVAVSLLVLAVFLLTKKDGKSAVVEIDGRTVAVYSLDKNGIYPLNGGTNILVIEDGEAYLTDSSCPDHTCERMGRISHTGESIICLPNKLSVKISSDTADGVDLVS